MNHRVNQGCVSSFCDFSLKHKVFSKKFVRNGAQKYSNTSKMSYLYHKLYFLFTLSSIFDVS